MKSEFAFRSLVATASLALAACSGAPGSQGSLPGTTGSGGGTGTGGAGASGSAGASSATGSSGGSSATAGSGATTPAQAWVLATYNVSYDAKTNTLSMTEANSSATAGATSADFKLNPDTFGPVSRGPQKLQISNGANSGPQATCGDAAHNIPAQANSFCTSATLTNNSNNYNDLVWIQLSNMSPSSVTVAQAGAGDNIDTIPTALNGLVSQATGALSYGNIAPGGTFTREWVFRNVGSTNFTFQWTLLAAPSHAYANALPSRPTFTDACTTGTQLLFPGDNFDVIQGQDLPFPVTIFNVTGTVFSLSPDGVFSLDPLFEPSGPDATNTALPATGESSGTVFPFWTNQIPRASGDTAGSSESTTTGQVCTLTEGSTVGSRIFDVTWENMRMAAGSGTDQNTLFTYTVRFHEGSDNIELQYDVMHDANSWTTDPPTPANQTLTTRSRGGIATIGFQGITGSGGCTSANNCLQLGFDTAVLPGTTAAYPRGLTFQPNSTN